MKLLHTSFYLKLKTIDFCVFDNYWKLQHLESWHASFLQTWSPTQGQYISQCLALPLPETKQSGSLQVYRFRETYVMQNKIHQQKKCQKTFTVLQTLYPFSEDFVEGVVLQDEVQHTESAPPVLELVKESEGSENTRRFLFQLKFNSRPYVGAMNLTGQIVDWSLPALSTIQSQVCLISVISIAFNLPYLLLMLQQSLVDI